MSARAERVVYTYAVTRPFDPTEIAGVCGVDDADVGLIIEDDLAAVVSTVPRAHFDEAARRARLEDLAELEVIARAHHSVVDAVATVRVALPFRLATIHHGEPSVREVLRHGGRQFHAALDRFEHRVELGVKVYAEPAPTRPPTGRVIPATGREYLRQRREQADRRDAACHIAADLARRVDSELVAVADDWRHHRPQNPQLSGARGDNILNAAYLVEVDRIGQFAAHARSLDADLPGTRIELTGPWAPYSFAELDGDVGSPSPS